MKSWKVRLTILLSTLAMLLATTSPAMAQEDAGAPNEGEPKHEINELQNKLHHTDAPSKELRPGEWSGGTVIWNWR